MNDHSEYEKITDEQLSETKQCVQTFENDGCNPDQGLPELTFAVRNRFIYDQIRTGVVQVDLSHRIIDFNSGFEYLILDKEAASSRPNFKGSDFYSTIGIHCEIDGPDFCPFATVKTTLRPTETTLRVGDRTLDMYVQARISPETREISGFLVELSDSKKYTILEKKIDLLQEAGRQLTDLTTDEIKQMSDRERKELLKCRIIDNFTKIFHYHTFELRLLNTSTHELDPFIAVGLTEEAKSRVLHPEATGNGTTGNVALFNKPYYCEDIQGDSFYLTGAEDTRSTFTLPLSYHREVLGTFHIESPFPSDFSLGEQHLLEFFSNDIAEAIHILKLLSEENRKAAWEKVVKIQNAVAMPFDHLIRDSFTAFDKVFIYRAEFLSQLDCLKKSLQHSDVETLRKAIDGIIEDQERFVQETRESMSMMRHLCRLLKNTISHEKDELENWGPMDGNDDLHLLLRNRRVLVLDKDDKVLSDAHQYLEKWGCIVETASDALTALQMIKGSTYDAIFTERLPLGGMDAEQFLIRLKDIYPDKVPLIIMKDEAYDFEHIIVHCRSREGLHVGIIQRIPFIESALLSATKTAILVSCERDANGKPILLQDDPSNCDGSVVESTTGDTSDSTVGISGFHLQKNSKRFDQWAEQIYKETRSDHDDPPLNLTSLDAT